MIRDSDALVEHLQNTGVLKSENLIRAFAHVDRASFVRPEHQSEAYEDYPLPIGEGQTISQPTTVAMMLELLEPREGNRVLDVGSGSGWTTALLAAAVGESGNVLGLERIPSLVAFGQANLAKYAFPHARIEKAGREIGKASEGPYDRILVSADADTLPGELRDQLGIDGVLVIPIRGVVTRLHKTGERAFETKTLPGFSFVPLISE